MDGPTKLISHFPLLNHKGSIVLPVVIFYFVLLSAAILITTLSHNQVRHYEGMVSYYQKSVYKDWSEIRSDSDALSNVNMMRYDE